MERGKKANIINVVVYARASTNDQATGIDTQIAVVTNKVESLSFRNIIKTFLDEGVSGDSFPEDRPAFKQMIDFIQESNNSPNEKPIKELWFQTWDRIARDVDLLGHARITLKRLGIEAYSTDDNHSGIQRRIYDVLGEEELRKIRLKSEQGIQRRIQEKKVLSRAPFGYKIENEKLVVDEELRPLITEIFIMFENNSSLSKISFRFNISISTLSYMRRNPIYTTGEYYWRGKAIYKVEPIIKNPGDENN